MFSNSLRPWLKNSFNCSIKSVQSDWGGGGFRPFTDFLQQLGILHQIICPHIHHHNGVVERKHRHIVELRLTLVAKDSLPLTYWDQAFLTSVYLINWLRSSSINSEIPNEKLFNQKLDYNFLGVFGCAHFPLLRPYTKNKLQFRSQEFFFLSAKI